MLLVRCLEKEPRIQKTSTKNIKQNWKDLAKATEGSFEFINDAVSSCGVLGDLLGESGKQVMGMIQGIATAGIATGYSYQDGGSK